MRAVGGQLTLNLRRGRRSLGKLRCPAGWYWTVRPDQHTRRTKTTLEDVKGEFPPQFSKSKSEWKGVPWLRDEEQQNTVYREHLES